jgi:universal stress protein family protein
MTSLILIAIIAGGVTASLIAASRRHRRPTVLRAAPPGGRRILVPFTGGALNERVLEAAIRVSRAEHATLVPAYLLIVPLRLPEDAPMAEEVSRAMPLLEAIEHAAHREGVPVDARIEKGRTPTHALSALWEAERFDRIIAPAPDRQGPGFTPKDLTWILTNSPVETLVLRPQPTLEPGDRQLPRLVNEVRRLVGAAR